ncbi:MAG: hypothetical protein WAP20_07600 [Limnochordia bacterium]|nr:hypothetical protein [Bacillota bacterium]HOB09414.1 hypothetical protein [Limnochordia bacterium]NLH31495.1 hypothetical protein [Bacillota bacterium]HPT93533.1 hypothetical protein [Limnochordia bacterium]HPZ31367.1 hypothetical protein [Limnochordia bacterium]
MTRQEKLKMIKNAMIALAQDKRLDREAKKRGLISLGKAYRRELRELD